MDRYIFKNVTDAKLIVHNVAGDIAICTGWSSPEYVFEKLLRHVTTELPGRADLKELSKALDRVAVVGTLYGGGLDLMIRNLMYNPQITTIIWFGKDLSGSKDVLRGWTTGDVTELPGKHEYESGRTVLGTTVDYYREYQINPGGTSKPIRIHESLNPPASVYTRPKLIEIADHTDVDGCLNAIYNAPVKTALPDRITVPEYRKVVRSFPSNESGHTIIADTIADGWAQLLTTLHRFGVPRTYRNGKERNELRNMKVVINNPADLSDLSAEPYSLDIGRIQRYRDSLMDRTYPTEGTSYTYGNRIREYFGVDQFHKVVDDLEVPGDSRHAYVTLWDPDMDGGRDSSPCLVSLFFRRIDNQLHLTVTFRTHNGGNAWPINAAGLAEVMQKICDLLGQANQDVRMGTLTVLSLSISLAISDIPQVQPIIQHHQSRAHLVTLDPNGYFKVTVDKQVIVVQHYHPETDLLLKTYQNLDPQRLMATLQKDHAVSTIQHAMYIASQIERAAHCIKYNTIYIQDKKHT
jgi:thymidylate synthase